MELAISGAALALLYVASNQNNDENNESFQNRNALPNTNTPDRNYPSEEPMGATDNDRTSSLSTVNKYDGGEVYTDKYFDKSYERPHPEPEGLSYEYKSLTGDTVGTDYFTHNNMVPFFGSKLRSDIKDANSNEGIMDIYSGSGSNYITKSEQAPLFVPEENKQWGHGMPVQTEFVQSRMNSSMRMANTKPFESENVGPGMGLGYTAEGGHGYNSGMMMREKWMPKTADQLRVDNNPKSSGMSLYGHEGPADSSVKHIATREQMGTMEKNRPEQSFRLDDRDIASASNGQRDIGRLFTTTGAGQGMAMHSIPIDRAVSRPETTRSYTGAAGGDSNGTYIQGEYMPSHNIELGAVPFAVANAQGRNPAVESDFGMTSKKAYPNNRSSNKDQGYFGAVGRSISSAVAPLLDVLRPSRKENAVGTLRPYQNPGTSVPNSYIFNQADRPGTTTKETTEVRKQHMNVNANQLGGAYKVTDHQVAFTNRKDTDNFAYTGSSSAAGGARQMPSYLADYNQRNNDIKSSTIDGRLVKGNMSLMNGNINMREINRDSRLKNDRAVSGNMPIQSPDASNIGMVSGSLNNLTSTIQMERNTPDMTNMLKKNPYVVDYRKGL